jgi:hypothetical protein
MSKDTDQKRKAGTLLLFLGTAGAYFAIYRPLALAQDGAPSVITSRLVIALLPLLIGYGAAYALFPSFVDNHLGGYPEERPSAPSSAVGWLFVIAILLFGIALSFWAQTRLNALGYSFSF